MYKANITYLSGTDSKVPLLFEHSILGSSRELCAFKAALYVRDFLGKEVSFVRVKFSFEADAEPSGEAFFI